MADENEEVINEIPEEVVSTENEDSRISKALDGIQSKLDSLKEERVSNVAPPEQSGEATVPDDELMWSDPKAYAAKLKKQIVQEIQKDMKVQNEFSDVKNRLLKEFPELEDTNSSFYKDIDKEISRRQSAGEITSPQTIEDVAYALDRKRLKAKGSQAAGRTKPASEGSSLGKVLGNSSSAAPELSNSQKDILRKLGKNEDWGKGAFTDYKSGKEAIRK